MLVIRTIFGRIADAGNSLNCVLSSCHCVSDLSDPQLAVMLSEPVHLTQAFPANIDPKPLQRLLLSPLGILNVGGSPEPCALRRVGDSPTTRSKVGQLDISWAGMRHGAAVAHPASRTHTADQGREDGARQAGNGDEAARGGAEGRAGAAGTGPHDGDVGDVDASLTRYHSRVSS